jgi:capsule polysaccharide export protein KpsC/LpsZ
MARFSQIADWLVTTIDCIQRLRSLPEDRTVVFAFHFNEWKRSYLEQAYRDLEWVFVPFKQTALELHPLIRAAQRPVFLCWGNAEDAATRAYAQRRGIPIWRMEDGFVRSLGLGAKHTRPMSLVLDESGTLYFDARKPSSLETLLSTYDFKSDRALMERARVCIDRIRAQGISKYNLEARCSAREAFDRLAVHDRKRILVLGQVEDDASIRFGAPPGSDNGRLVWEARRRNPNADIFFKPHPDVLHGLRPALTALEDLQAICHVLTEPMSLAETFQTVDEVYTISSLGGFEALLHEKRVVCWGRPFYAGWGLTKDLNPLPRRTRKLSVEEVFAAAYLLYPRYFNPYTGERIELEDVLGLLEDALRFRRLAA